MNPLRIALVVITLLGLQACCFPSPSSAEGAERARQLTSVQLQAIYERMESHNNEVIFWGSKMEPLPEEFSRLGAIHGDVGHLNRLVFGGCMDDKAVLSFKGLWGEQPREIWLIPGEREEMELLWTYSVE